ncbi:MAG: MSHA biogenesis protein MshM [Gammaproteobacteria bacterium]|jgi:MSHA biogenesis protein MshM
MYNEYFGLNQAPFRITPDTALFYTGGSRGDVLDALVYAITSGEGIVKVVGEVGTGKTMLCRMLEERLPNNVQIAYLANPSLTPQDILHAVALELELDIAGDANRLQVMHRLQETLLARHANNQRVVVLVEEAQSMPVDTLEEIRLLSNLETKNEKLLQIVLFGQPELDDNLSKPQIRQLRERITHSFSLTPLGREEIKDYVAFRLRASGYRGRDAFTSDAYRTMSRASEGLTRRVNIIADKAMLAAFADDTHDVSAKHVKSAIADSEFSAANRRKRHSPLFAMGAGASLAVIVAAAVGWYAGNQAGSAPQSPLPSTRVATASAAQAEQTLVKRSVPPASVVAVSVGAEELVVSSAAEPAVAAQVSTAMPITAASSGQGLGAVLAGSRPMQDVQNTQALPADRPSPVNGKSVSTAGEAPAPVAKTEALKVAVEVAEKASVVAGLQLPASAVTTVASVTGNVASGAIANRNAADRADPASEARTNVAPAETSRASASATVVGDAPKAVAKTTGPVVAPRIALADKSIADKSVVNSTADSRTELSSTTVDANPPKDRSLLQWRLGQTRQWLQRVDKNRYSIQLLATDAGQRNNLEAFLARRKRAGQIGRIFVYTTTIHSREWYGVLFGEFESYSQAREALRKLPRELLLHKPFIRNVKDINALG